MGKQKRKLGIALAGLGTYATEELAPALTETEYCYLAGIVTGSPDKAKKWKKKYDLPPRSIYNYQNFDSIRDNPDIDIAYIVLPNSLHAEFAVRAAQSGKHVICEKPMAITVEECDRMIDACREANRKLSIGYRLHFEPHNQELMQIGQEKTFGSVRTVKAENGMSEVSGWRINKHLAGGGPLMDVGIYCVQGCRYATGLEPIAVRAQEGPKTSPDKFQNIEEALSWQFEFENGIIAVCKTSYAEELNVLRLDAERGWAELSPAYEYKGIKGKTHEGRIKHKEINQQAKQMDDFALAILHDRPSPVPGEMGRQDVKIMEAIYEAMRTGRRIEIS